ncbi:MAG: flagellar biosynthesis anti-sigma factor FlgM [Pirellulales bacterium]
MQIWGINNTQAASSVRGVESAESAKAGLQQPLGEVHDAVALSVDGVSAADATAGDIRMDRVQAIRAAIADGSYETAEKLDIALDRLLESIG